MDIDTGRPKPIFLEYFALSPQDFAWREPRPGEITNRRVKMTDKLIFDILLLSGGIPDPDLLYPPKGVEGLERLLEAIDASHYDALKKECLVYFLLKWHEDERAERFQVDRCIPPQFTALASAYWHLDSGINVPSAVAALSDARLNRDYSSKILQAISLAPNATPLILKYVRTAKPPLIEPIDLDLYIIALAETSFFGAWQFQRGFAENDTRHRLLTKVLEWVVTPKPRSAPLSQLLALPFTLYEESVFDSFTLKPPPTLSTSALAILQDIVCVRLIQGGRYVDAIKMDRKYTASTVRDTNTEPRSQERTAMVQELLPSLPRPERVLLEADLDLISEGKSTILPISPTSAGTKNPPTLEDISMSQSWEEIRVPQDILSASITKASIAPTVSERAGAPRFGGPIPASINVANTSLSASISQPPIVPAAGVTSTASGPRKSLPLQSLPMVPTVPSTMVATPGRTPLSHTASQFLLGHSPATSSSFTLGGTKSAQPPSIPLPLGSRPFESALSKANAFYTPPNAKSSGSKSAFSIPIQANAPSATFRWSDRRISGVSDPVDDVDVDLDVDGDAQMDTSLGEGGGTEQDDEGEGREEEEVPQLHFSVFGNGNGTITPSISEAAFVSDRISTRPRLSLSTSGPRASEGSGKRVPPGAFHAEGDEGDDTDEGATEWQTSAATNFTSAHSAASGTGKRKQPARSSVKTSSGADSSKARTTRASKSLRSTDKKMIPGSLIDDDEHHTRQDPDDGALTEEEEDRIAPLPLASPRKLGRAKGGSRTSLASTDDEQGEGVSTRRRSSRISTSLMSPDASPPQTSSKRLPSTRTRKSTSKAAGSSTATSAKKKRGS
ncbi:hypothetical protein BDN72DRAFT_895067 [Pluteus cervinus]|uniref:Uncharacterized protein n=1 Tax=Pluteus cervinus TaxID=181527 RepID=A0ACD3B387_9AGAR|nr:hypothetical protein BDN72DRAFT_895067 [Pluteus cervinus]